MHHRQRIAEGIDEIEPPAWAWAMASRPEASTASPSGPRPPESCRKVPTIGQAGSGASAMKRQTALARVAAR